MMTAIVILVFVWFVVAIVWLLMTPARVVLEQRVERILFYSLSVLTAIILAVLKVIP